jgi:dolichol-phosphate mannosyltransferase
MRRLLKIDFVRFCIVGASGFVINLALLTLLYKRLHSPLFIAQILAAEVALFSNFMFHHHWTYKANNVRKTISKLIVQFHMTSWVAVVGSALIVSFGVHVMHLQYFTALVAASATALFWNFAWSKFVIWRHQHEPSDDKEEAA